MKNVYKKMARMVVCAATAVAIASSVLAANKTWTAANGAVWTYATSGVGVSIRKYASPEGNVVVPGSIEDRPVVAIYNKAFMDCPWIRSVKIPDGVTSIGSQAFSGCTWLESVTFPSCEFKIGTRAFENCTRLAEIECKGEIKSVGSNAFRGCAALGDGVVIIAGRVILVNGSCPSEVVLPEGTTHIVGGAFRSCETLRTVHIPASLESVASSAFDGCSGLREFIVDPENPYFYSANGMLISKSGNRLVCGVNGDVAIPDGVVEIGSNAFSGLDNLTSVTIPNSVTSIGNYAFENCSGLMSVIIPNSVMSIGYSAFEGCSGLMSVIIPDSVTDIASSTFENCENLTSVTIPNSVTNIESYAFRNCTALTHIDIPASVASISVDAFDGCYNLDNIDNLTFGTFDGGAKHVYTGLVLKENNTVGIIQLETAKATSRGVRVKGAIMLDDSKKYAIKSAQGQVMNGVLKVETSVSKLGDMSLIIGLAGFNGNIGETYTVRSGEASGAAVLKGSITKTYLDEKGKFKTARVTLAGFSVKPQNEGEESETGEIWADGLIQERGKDDRSFSTTVR